MKNMKNYLKIIRYKNRIIINNLIENIFPTMSGQRYEIWNQLVLKEKMAKIICSSAPLKPQVFPKGKLEVLICIILNLNKKYSWQKYKNK